MEGLELICFQIISAVGTSRSYYIEAIQSAKEGQFEKAEELIHEGEVQFKNSHNYHSKLIQEESTGEKTEVNVLLLHAEDLLMSAETFGIISREFIDLYKILFSNK